MLGKLIAAYYRNPTVRPLLRWLYRYITVPGRFIQGVGTCLFFLWLRQYGRHRIGVRPVPEASVPRIVMLVVTILSQDPRVKCEAQALAASGFDVTIICPAWWRQHKKEKVNIEWGPGIRFCLLPQKTARFAHYFPYVFSFRMLHAALQEQVWAYHTHDLTTAFIGLIAAAIKRAACVCDFHEWYAENVTYHEMSQSYKLHPPLKRRLFVTFERLVLHTATAVITVCESISQALEQRYHAPKPVSVIRNIPYIPFSRYASKAPATAATDLRQVLDIDADKLIVLYQGGLGPSRNLEPVIEAMACVSGAVLVIRGPEHETYSPAYLKLAQRAGAGDKVYCLAPVPSSHVVEEARAADIGLYTVLNAGLNFYLALPNKVFEYMAAHLPILVGNFPEVRRLVETYQIGLCFDPDSPASIAVAVNQMVEDHHFRETCKANIPLALHALRADQEWDKLVRLYRGFSAP